MRIVLCMLAFSIVASHARAESTRQALIIGVNKGSESLGLPALKRAEADAQRLARMLVSHGGFAAEDVVVLTGSRANKAAVFDAGRRLSRRRRRAPQGSETLFAFFYTGHGTKGQLFLDGPDGSAGRLSAGDVERLLDQSGADLKVGYFDACFSGAMASKGAPTPLPFNPLRALPEARLGGKGTIIITSSRADERAYEDERLGGLFTHYFLEAFTRVGPDRIAIKLVDMLHYASDRTRAHAREVGVRQTPQHTINAKLHGPVFFAFPRERESTLVFGAPLQGCYRVRYPPTGLEEQVHKTRGQTRMVSVFPGVLEVEGCEVDSPLRPARLEIDAGRTGTVSTLGAELPTVLLPGKAWQQVVARGPSLRSVRLGTVEDAWTLNAEIGYRHDLMVDPGTAGAHGIRPVHGLAIGAWAYRGPLGVGLVGGWGSGERTLGDWGYYMRAVDLRAAASAMLTLEPVGLRLRGSFGGRRSDIEYSDGVAQTRWGAAFGLTGGLVIPLGGRRPVAFATLDIGMDLLRVPISDVSEGFEAVPVAALGLMSGHW